MEFLFFAVLPFIVVAGLLFAIYNKLRARAEAVKRTRSNIFATVKKRLDLAQRLSDIARAYGEHEKLTHITVSANAADISGTMQADQRVENVIHQITSIAQNYPALKADATYQMLMGQLQTLENEIHERRETYNRTVEIYNTYRSSMPQVLFASSLGFAEAPYYEVSEDGLERLATFETDDGAMLREQMSRIGTRAGQGAVIAGRFAKQKAVEAAAMAKPHLEDVTRRIQARRDTGTPGDDRPAS